MPFARTATTLALTAMLLAAPALSRADDHKQDITEKYTVLTVNETAEQKIQQDRLRTSIQVEEKAFSAADVQAQVNKKMQAALGAAKRFEKTIKASTGHYSVYKNHDNAYWIGRQTLELDSGTPKDLLDLVGQLQKQDLTTQGLTYYLSDEAQKALNEKLTTEALKKVKARAEAVASTLGLKVARFAEINPGYSGGYQPVYRAYDMMMAKGAMAEGASAPVAQGDEQSVQVSVNAKIYLQ